MARSTSRLILLRSRPSRKYFSTATVTASTVTKGNDGSRSVLFKKLLALGDGDAGFVTGALDEWVKEGKSVSRLNIIGCVSQFRKFKKYQHALQLYEWMDRSKKQLNNADRAIRIDLLAKTEGISSAEKYFNSLQGSAKTEKTYGALLNCYCKKDMLENATELFEKMKELHFASNALNYNNLMSLYLRLGQPEKVLLLAQEMEEKKVDADMYTYNQLMSSYASLKDFDAVQEVVEKMKTNGVKHDWFTYGNLATIYVNAGLVDKANVTLKSLEKMSNLKDREAFHTLITSYAGISDSEGVNRAWESLKSNHPKTTNTSYLIILLALSKLNNVDALEKCFREWESGYSSYDVRLVNVMLESYLSRNMIQEANLLSESVAKRWIEPNLRMLDLLMNLCLKKNQVDLALKYLETGVLKPNPEKKRWFPTQETVNLFLNYFEEKKDVDSADRFCSSMRKISRIDSRIYNSLLLTYIAAGKVEPQMRQVMEEDSIMIDPETEILLLKVCTN